MSGNVWRLETLPEGPANAPLPFDERFKILSYEMPPPGRCENGFSNRRVTIRAQLVGTPLDKLEADWRLRRKMAKLATDGGTLKYTPPSRPEPVLFDVLYATCTRKLSWRGYVRELEFLCGPFARGVEQTHGGDV